MKSITLEEAKKSEEKKHVIINFILIWILVQLISSAVIMTIYAATGRSMQDLNAAELMNDEQFLYLNLFITVFEIAIPIWYCTKQEKRSLRSMGFTKKDAGSEYIFGFWIGILLLVCTLLVSVTAGAIAMTTNTKIPFTMILIFGIGFLIQGAAEEVLCRGFFMTSLARKHSIITAVLISSLAFSVMHVMNGNFTLIPFINITLFGMVMAVVMLKTDSIWMSCAIHSAWNFCQGNIFGIQVSGMGKMPTILNTINNESLTIVNGGKFGAEGGISTTIVLVIALFVLLCVKKKEAVKKVEEKE